MKITVIFFGILKDVVAKAKLTVKDAQSTEDLKSQLVKQHPELQRYVYRVVVNKRVISGNKALKDGDEVALVPPFVGG